MTIPVVVLLLVAVSFSNAVTDSSTFQTVLNEMMGNNLGLNKFRKYLQQEVNAELSPVDSSAILRKIVPNLRNRLVGTEEKLYSMRRTIESERDGTVGSFNLCCERAQSPEACMIRAPRVARGSIGLPDERERMLHQAFLGVTNEPPGLRNVFASQEDDVVVYSTNRSVNCKKKLIQPTRTTWYRETLQDGIPKDVVIVLDTSQAMNVHVTSGTSRFDLERDAVIETVNSLADTDRVAVVPTTTTSYTTQECHTKKLSFATYANVDTLSGFLKRHVQPQGPSALGPAIRKAFAILQAASDSHDDSIRREAIVVVVLGTEPKDSEAEILSIVSEEKARLTRNVVFFTGFVGESYNFEATVKLLHDMAVPDGRNSSAGAGRWFLVDRQDKTGLQRTLHNAFTRHGVAADTVTYGTPQIDDLGSEAVTYACLPVHLAGYLAGVICTVIRIQDLIEDVVFPIPELSHTYALVIDSTSKLLIHPLLHLPDESSTIQNIVVFSDVERAPQARSVLFDMLRGVRGNKTFNKTNDFSDGRGPITVRVTYNWSPINGTNLSVCVVTEDSSVMVTSLRNVIELEEILYHRIDLDDDGKANHLTCLYHGFEVYPTFSTVKLTPAAYESPAHCRFYRDTHYSVRLLKGYLTENSQAPNLGIKDTARKFIHFGIYLESIWRQTLDLRKPVLQPKWVSMGFINGVFIGYPGGRLPDSYDHTTRPWYQEALRYPGKIVILPPYIDTETIDSVITISQTVPIESCCRKRTQDNALRPFSTTLGVLAADFTMSHFQDMLARSFAECKYPHRRCMVVNSAGYLVFHPHFLYPTSSVHVHIVEKEPSVASTLIEHGVLVRTSCSNPTREEINKGWKIKTHYYDGAFRLYAINDTNVYVLIVSTKQQSGIPPCGCKEKTCHMSCECPCVVVNSHGRCDSNRTSPDANASLSPLCLQPKPPPDDEFDTEIHYSKNLSSCSPGCRYARNESLCRQRGCAWCQMTDDEGHRLSRATCALDVQRCNVTPVKKTPTTQPTRATGSRLAPSSTSGAPSGSWTLGVVASVSVLGTILFVVIVVAIVYVYVRRKSQLTTTLDDAVSVQTIYVSNPGTLDKDGDEYQTSESDSGAVCNHGWNCP